MPARRFSIGLRAALAIFAVTLFVNVTCAARVLHNFNFTSNDGNHPYAGLISDTAGNLYGTTLSGGAAGLGSVFELIPNANGTWTEKVLYNFSHDSGFNPMARLILDPAGNLYGTTFSGGAHDGGTAFELTPNAGGSWTEKVLRSFFVDGKGGTGPAAGLIFDAAGNLYGTTFSGGAAGGAAGLGTVFELMPNADGTWTEKVLHHFNADGKHGYYPYANMVFDAAGNLYGTTYDGVISPGDVPGLGTVFELTPHAGWELEL